jgi:RNA polymerase sigma-70 factor (ECF subfamily)
MNLIDPIVSANARQLAKRGVKRQYAVATVPGRATMPTNEDLQRWIAAVATNADKQAFASLFRFYAPRVKGFLMRSGSAEALADELAQETMVAVWRKASSFRPEQASLSTWIYTIARNLRVSHFRRMPVSDPLDENELAHTDGAQSDTHPTPDDRIFARQRAQGVAQALAALPAEQAQILRLSFFDDHAHARIAQELGIPLGTVKSRIRLAVTQLRRVLDDFKS